MTPICWPINSAKLKNDVHKICKSMQGTLLRVLLIKLVSKFSRLLEAFFFEHNVTACGYQVVIKYQKID
jgi:hypothetical protein